MLDHFFIGLRQLLVILIAGAAGLWALHTWFPEALTSWSNGRAAIGQVAADKVALRADAGAANQSQSDCAAEGSASLKAGANIARIAAPAPHKAGKPRRMIMGDELNRDVINP